MNTTDGTEILLERGHSCPPPGARQPQSGQECPRSVKARAATKHDPTDGVDILLVEDNPRDAELALRALKGRNLADKLVWVKDGAAALELIFGRGTEGGTNGNRKVCHRPKVILLDLKLPKMDGLEVLGQLKANEESKTIPVVVLTSSREEEDIVRSYKMGVNSYVLKPVSFDSFSEAVAQLGLYWLLLNQRPEAAANPPAPSPTS